MNKILKYIPALLLLPLLLASCAGEKVRIKEEGGKPGVVRFTLNSTMRAVGNENATRPTPALEREKKVNSLYAVVYRKSSGVHYKTVECVTPTGSAAGTYEFDNEKSGEFYFYLVANPDEELKNALMAGPSTQEDLGKLVAKQTPGEDNTAANFLMTSDRVDVTVASKAATMLPDPIKLVRVAARFDFYNKIEGLEVTKITFGKRYTQSHLFAQVNHMDDLASTTDKEYEGSLFNNGALTATIYGYENDTRNETFFTLEATYKGKPLKPETIRLENFVIKRNHLYNIILHDMGGAVDPNKPDDKFGEIKYEIVVVDWEEGAAFGMSEDDALKPLYVEYDAEIKNAPYMTPYLKGSQPEIYTTTSKATEVTFKVRTFVKEGSLALKDGFNEAGVTIAEEGTFVKNTATGEITRTYKLTLPEKDQFVAYNVFDAAGKLSALEFFEIPLVAKNYSGEVIKEFVVKHGRIKMPLEYFMDTPLNKAGNGFAASPNKVSDIGYFEHRDYIVPNLKNLTIDGQEYHLPIDMYELMSIIPTGGSSEYYVGNGEEIVNKDNVKEWIVFPCWVNAVPGNKSGIRNLQSDFRTDKTAHVSYALRFKNYEKDAVGNQLVIAYRYESVGDFQHVTEEENVVPSYFKITSRYIGANWNGTVDDIAKEEFWNNNTESDVTRKIYAMGLIDEYYPDHANTARCPELGVEAHIVTPKMRGPETHEEYAIATFLQNSHCYSNHAVFLNRQPGYKNITVPVWLFSNK